MNVEATRVKPRAFSVLTRLVYVHAAFYVAVTVPSLIHAGLRGLQGAQGVQASVFLDGIGIVIAVIGCLAMFAVAKRCSSRALSLLRVLLWIAVVKVLLELLMQLVGSSVVEASSLPLSLVNELFLIALAIYWSRPAHARYLASFENIPARDGDQAIRW